jgi:hypothetical protein
MSIRAELNELRAELDALKTSKATPPPEDAAAPPGEEPGLDAQLRHLIELAGDMLEEAEDTVVNHPKAAIAGALALGLVIGRLTAR